MAKLTRKQERLLRRTADGVRMYVACLTVAAPLMCVFAAAGKYAAMAAAHGTPEIPPMSTWGNIAGIYLPMFAAVGAYVWATRAAPVRSLAPNGFAMALFRDAFTVVVMTVVLLIPWMLYRSRSTLQSVNAYVVWYQTVLTVVAGGAFAYYFNGRIAADQPAPADASAAAAPKAATRRAARSDEPVLQPVAEG
jgi:hypothetical protein